MDPTNSSGRNGAQSRTKSKGDQGKQGWRLSAMWPGFNSRTRRHMWVDFVVGSLLASRGFSPGTPVFPSPQRPTFPNSNLIWNSRAAGLSVVRLLVVTLVKQS